MIEVLTAADPPPEPPCGLVRLRLLIWLRPLYPRVTLALGVTPVTDSVICGIPGVPVC